jgi:hypothetical protein
MSQNPQERPVVLSEKTPQGDPGDYPESIHTLHTPDNRSTALSEVYSHTSPANTQDAPIQQWSSHIEVPDEVYDRVSHSRKVVIVALLSFCGFLAPISSTTILSAVPEVAFTYKSTGAIINLSNALYMLFMGLSPCFWGPLSQVYGRRWVIYSVLGIPPYNN